MFGSAPATAQYPATQYPASNFFGPASLQPTGIGANAENEITPTNRWHTVLCIGALVLVGYLAYHFNYRR